MPSDKYPASETASPAVGLTVPQMSALLDAKEREIIRLRRQVAWFQRQIFGQKSERRMQVKRVWKYLYRAVDKQGKTVDFLLTAKRDIAAAKRSFDKAIAANGSPDKIAMDKSGANKAAMAEINAGRSVPVTVRQVKYLNNIVEQDHRAIKCVTRPMLGFKSFRSAANVLAGVELMHMIRKGQFAVGGTTVMSFADQFYALAAEVRLA